MNNIYPNLEEAGTFCDIQGFNELRKEGGTWVHNPCILRNVLKGTYQNIIPLHAEIVITLKCNYSCSWCNYIDTINKYKDYYGEEMSLGVLKKIVPKLAKYKTDIMWTGGEPLLNRNLISGMELAKFHKIKHALYTNGSLLTLPLAEAILKTSPQFIRISLNSSDARTHSCFHGYTTSGSNNIFNNVYKNIFSLVEAKLRLNSNTKIGISIVFDDRNVQAIEDTLRLLSTIHGLDYVIIRPVHPVNANVTCIDKSLRLVPELNLLYINYRKVFTANNVDFIAFLPAFSDVTDSIINNSKCLAAGMFTEIMPNGDVLICSDKHGDPNYIVGNISVDRFRDIWKGRKRQDILNTINHDNCIQTNCKGRGLYFNKLFNQIELKRLTGNMNEISTWISAIQETLPKSHHNMFV